MATIARWITRNGHKVYLRKGGSRNVHSDYYRVEGKDVSGMHNTPLQFLNKKHALKTAKANVMVKNNHYSMNHDSKKYGPKEIHRMVTIYKQFHDKGKKIDRHELLHQLTRSGIPMQKAIAVVDDAKFNIRMGNADFSLGWFKN